MKRIIKNTIGTYGRQIITAGLSLYSSRWVLNSLGQSEYGLYSLMGSLIVFITFFNTVLASSSVRYFAYEMGKGEKSELGRWFNAALSLHIALALILVAIGWPIGEYLIRHILRIPIIRLSSCLWVFRILLVSAFVSMVSVPFIAIFSANQRITELSFWGVIQSVLSFILAWEMRTTLLDKLIVYAFGMMAIVVIIQFIQIARAKNIYMDCKIDKQFWFEKKKLKDIFSFALWNLFGSLGVLGRDQGSALLLNLSFGPTANAAFGIASQVSAQANQLSTAMLGAFSPEITTSEGRGDRKIMLDLSLKACKLSTILVMLLAVPLIAETDFILKIWLLNPPNNASTFCRMMLITFLIDKLTIGYMLAINAQGKIARYQATLGTCLIMTLPLAWLFIKINPLPTSIGYAFMITMAVTSFGRVIWGKILLKLSIKNWIFDIFIPFIILGIILLVVISIIKNSINAGYFRLLIIFIFNMILSSLFFVKIIYNGSCKSHVMNEYK